MRPAVVVAVWGLLLGGLTALLAAFPLDALAVGLLGGSAAGVLGLAAAVGLADRRRPERAQAPRAIPDLSLSTALAGVALCSLAVGAEVGMWLVIIGGGLLALALGGLARERRAQRGERSELEADSPR